MSSTTLQSKEAMKLIPEGSFPMGDADSQNVYVDAFWMDTFPVTNAEFKQFLKECPVWQKEAGIQVFKNPYYLFFWRGIIFPSKKRDHPVVYPNWYVAAAYCNWRSVKEGLSPCYDENNDFFCDFDKSGYRLPTEAEFEKAAKGNQNTVYPWGNSIDKSIANFDNYVGDTTEVGTYNPNPYGLYDMGGNIAHWCQDWYAEDLNLGEYKENPKGPETGTHKVYKGGSWGGSADMQKCSRRFFLLPVNCNPDFGFRCVKKA